MFEINFTFYFILNLHLASEALIILILELLLVGEAKTPSWNANLRTWLNTLTRVCRGKPVKSSNKSKNTYITVLYATSWKSLRYIILNHSRGLVGMLCVRSQ